MKSSHFTVRLCALNLNSKIATPNMDNVVKQSVHFTGAHTNSAVCTPANMESLRADMLSELI